jgi:hypothetical protein
MNPEGAYFYDQLDIDPRFTKVYEVGPAPWERSGPTISVYRISNNCNDLGGNAY